MLLRYHPDGINVIAMSTYRFANSISQLSCSSNFVFLFEESAPSIILSPQLHILRIVQRQDSFSGNPVKGSSNIVISLTHVFQRIQILSLSSMFPIFTTYSPISLTSLDLPHQLSSNSTNTSKTATNSSITDTVPDEDETENWKISDKTPNSPNKQQNQNSGKDLLVELDPVSKNELEKLSLIFLFPNGELKRFHLKNKMFLYAMGSSSSQNSQNPERISWFWLVSAPQCFFPHEIFAEFLDETSFEKSGQKRSFFSSKHHLPKHALYYFTLNDNCDASFNNENSISLHLDAFAVLPKEETFTPREIASIKKHFNLSNTQNIENDNPTVTIQKKKVLEALQRGISVEIKNVVELEKFSFPLGVIEERGVFLMGEQKKSLLYGSSLNSRRFSSPNSKKIDKILTPFQQIKDSTPYTPQEGFFFLFFWFFFLLSF